MCRILVQHEATNCQPCPPMLSEISTSGQLGIKCGWTWTHCNTLQPNLLIFCMVLLFLFFLRIILHHSQVRICFGLVIPTGMAKSGAVSIHTQHNTRVQQMCSTTELRLGIKSKYIAQCYVMMHRSNATLHYMLLRSTVVKQSWWNRVCVG